MPMFRLDPADPDHARALERLTSEMIVWMTTVSPQMQPQPSAVWFWWDGETVLVYSADSPRLRNIAIHPRVSLTFNSDPVGDDLSILYGLAALDSAAPAAKDLEGYRNRYHHRMPAIGMDWEGLSSRYRFPVRIRLTAFRRW